jgi:hypothetical protein
MPCDHDGPFSVVWLRGRVYIVCGYCKRETREQVDETSLEKMN